MHAAGQSSKPPRETSVRMGDLATLPVFLRLSGKTALVAGGSAGTAWKAELLAAAGAKVRLVWATPDHEAEKLVEEWPDRVTLISRDVADADFDGAAIAIGALEDDEAAAAFAQAARRRGIPVNVVDKPAFCDFQFGAIVNRSPLVIGISTDGGAPPLGQAIRSMIEALLPAGFAGWARAARSWRPRVVRSGLDGGQRKAFWRRFATMAMARPDEPPCPVEREAIIADLQCEAPMATRGHLALVGAGPGDPELLTLKAVRHLREADVILHDDLVGPGILAFARREARKIHVGKRGGEASCAQADISSLAVLLAREGNRVVRLKGGDPLLFGRAEEEIAAARAAGVPLTIVNGISAAFGAAADVGVPLTQRGLSRRVQFITGHDETGAVPRGLDWASLADRDTTTCIYMGRSKLEALMQAGLAAGLAPDTPARCVINGTRTDSHVVTGTAADIASRLASSAVQGPCIVLIGRSVDCVDQEAAAHSPMMAMAAE